MYYALVHYLNSYPASLDAFRRKYDPRVAVTPPHVTFLFPVDASIGEREISDHIAAVIKNWKLFSITLEGAVLSWDNLIFLTVSNGKSEIIKLHDQLYTGLLASHLRSDIEFIPHVTIGVANGENGKQILKEARQLQINQGVVVNKLSLIRCKDDGSPHEWEKVFTFEA